AASSHQRTARSRTYFAKSTSCSASGSKPRAGGGGVLTRRDDSRRSRWSRLRTLSSCVPLVVSAAVPRLDRVDARVRVEEQARAVAGDGHELAARERHELPTAARVDPEDAVGASARAPDP